jgi:xanthine dehydrogenase/oxidase
VAVDVDIFCNAGYSLDLSEAVINRGLFHVTNAYKIPNIRVRAFMCKTNSVTNTAFRGFGAPQGMLIAEGYLTHLADTLGLAPEIVRGANLYGPEDRTHYGQLIEANPLPRLWGEISKSADFEARTAACEEFNSTHRWRKRGLAMVPTMFGISFTAVFMNQVQTLHYTSVTLL